MVPGLWQATNCQESLTESNAMMVRLDGLCSLPGLCCEQHSAVCRALHGTLTENLYLHSVCSGRQCSYPKPGNGPGRGGDSGSGQAVGMSLRAALEVIRKSGEYPHPLPGLIYIQLRSL